MIGGRFGSSSYIKDKVAIPADFVQARFGQSFKIEGDKVVAYDASGNKVFSRTKPGELADFDEALEFWSNSTRRKITSSRHLATVAAAHSRRNISTDKKH